MTLAVYTAAVTMLYAGLIVAVPPFAFGTFPLFALAVLVPCVVNRRNRTRNRWPR